MKYFVDINYHLAFSGEGEEDIQVVQKMHIFFES